MRTIRFGQLIGFDNEVVDHCSHHLQGKEVFESFHVTLFERLRKVASCPNSDALLEPKRLVSITLC